MYTFVDGSEVLTVKPRKNEIPAIGAKSVALNTKEHVQNLGVIIDPDLNFEQHIRNMTKVSFYHKNARVRPFLQILLLVFKSLNVPSYLSDMVKIYVSAWSLRSSD